MKYSRDKDGEYDRQSQEGSNRSLLTAGLRSGWCGMGLYTDPDDKTNPAYLPTEQARWDGADVHFFLSFPSPGST